MLHSDLAYMGMAGYQYYLDNYTIENTYSQIVKHIE